MRKIAAALCLCVMTLLSVTTVAASQPIQYGHAYGGTGYEYGNAVAVDSDGNVYIAGFSADPYAWAPQSFLAKFDPNGALLWGRELAGSGDIYSDITQIALTASGDAYVVGLMDGFGCNVFAAKFNSAGSLLWSRGLMNLTYPESLAVDPSTGGFAIATAMEPNWEGAVASFNPDGSWRWMRHTADSMPYGVAVDPDGNTYSVSDRYVSGSYIGVTKYDSTGKVVAQKLLDTNTSAESAWDIELGPDGNLVIIGTQYMDQSALVAKLDRSLNSVWAETIAAPGMMLDGYRLGLPTDGSIYAVCRGYDMLNYTNSSALFHLDQSGATLSATWYGQEAYPEMLQLSDAALRPDGGMVFGGVSYGTPAFEGQALSDILVKQVNGSWAADTLTWTADRVWLLGDPFHSEISSMPVDDFGFDMRAQAWWGTVDAPAPALTVSAEVVYGANNTCMFTSNVSGGTGPYSYNWSFGDGTYSSLANATHTFETAGRWWVQLSVNDSSGNRGYASIDVRISGPPVIADLQVYPPSPAVGDWVYFYAEAFDPDGGTIVQYMWDFGDNSTVTTTANGWTEHVYGWSGNFTATVWVMDSDGETASRSATVFVMNEYNSPPRAVMYYYPDGPGPGTSVLFDGGASYDNDGYIVSYAWDFGDNYTAYGMTVNHTFWSVGYYWVTLTVTDNDGATSAITEELYVSENTPPVAAFSWMPEVPMEDQEVWFSAYGSYDPDGYIWAYTWDFGDGWNETRYWDSAAYHRYGVGGSYNVTLTVEDDRGATASVTMELMVNMRPIAVISGPEVGKVGTPMQFSGAGSYDPDGSIVDYSWYFWGGDEVQAEGMNASHVFAEPGSYMVYLSVTDDMGAQGYAEMIVSVLEPKPPVAVIGYSPYPILVGAATTFDARASVDPDGSISTCIWQFGDGSVGTGAQADHSYRYPGQYEVRLVVIDEDGLAAETTVTITVMVSKPKTIDIGAGGISLAGQPLVSSVGFMGLALVAGGAVAGIALMTVARKGFRRT